MDVKKKGVPPPQLLNHQFTKGSERARLAGQKGGKVSPLRPNPYKPRDLPEYLQ